MPPKRPPPLSPALFSPTGPLAPGSAPLPPSPTTVQPRFVIDAHTFPAFNSSAQEHDIFKTLPDAYPKPEIKNVVEVKLDVNAQPAQEVLGIKPLSIHPTILNLSLPASPSMTTIAKSAIDIIIPISHAAGLSEREWDLVEEAVGALDGHGATGEKEVGLAKYGGESEVEDGEVKRAISPVVQGGKIIISGLLPPPLSKQSSALSNDEGYNLYMTRLSQLCLHPNVYLKVLPPVVDTLSVPPPTPGADGWWRNEDRKGLMRVLKMYISPAIELFGTHRLIFGTSPTLPLDELEKSSTDKVKLEQPVPSSEWYTVFRKCITELGEDEDAVTAVLGGNASAVYELE